MAWGTITPTLKPMVNRVEVNCKANSSKIASMTMKEQACFEAVGMGRETFRICDWGPLLTIHMTERSGRCSVESPVVSSIHAVTSVVNTVT